MIDGVLATLDSAIAAPVTGMSAKLAAMSTASAPLRVGVTLGEWTLDETQMSASSNPVVTTMPAQTTTDQKLTSRPDRPAEHRIETRYEIVTADAAELKRNVPKAATAFAQVLDQIREYSDANGGTIVELVDPITFRFGAFGSDNATSHGWIASYTVLERGQV